MLSSLLFPFTIPASSHAPLSSTGYFLPPLFTLLSVFLYCLLLTLTVPFVLLYFLLLLYQHFLPFPPLSMYNSYPLFPLLLCSSTKSAELSTSTPSCLDCHRHPIPRRKMYFNQPNYPSSTISVSPSPFPFLRCVDLPIKFL